MNGSEYRPELRHAIEMLQSTLRVHTTWYVRRTWLRSVIQVCEYLLENMKEENDTPGKSNSPPDPSVVSQTPGLDVRDPAVEAEPQSLRGNPHE